MKYSILSFGIVAVYCIILAGCATTNKPSPPPPPPRETVIFDYTLPIHPHPKLPSDPKVTIALLQTQRSSDSDTSIPMKAFVRATTEDLKDILIASGYDVRGPFSSFSSIPNVDKQESNGVLVPMVKFDFDLTGTDTGSIEKKSLVLKDTNKSRSKKFGLESSYHYKPKGPAVVDCSLFLDFVGSPVSEILSKEMITASPVMVDFVSDTIFDYKPTIQDQIAEDNRTYNAFNHALETQYDEIMDKTYDYLISDELAKFLPEVEPPRTNITFDYLPSTKAPVGSADITFAIVNTYFKTPVPMFQGFAENMTKDFQEILTANGYRIKGPFKNYDDMTYPDKAGSNLVLTTSVKFSSDTSQLKWNDVKVMFKSQEEEEYYRASGSITIKCHINLILYESLTRERMWTKSLSITPLVVHLLSSEKYPSQASMRGQLKEDNQFHADLGKALQSQYNEIMGKIEAYLDPREMKILNKQVQELRKMKVFQ